MSHVHDHMNKAGGGRNITKALTVETPKKAKAA
jgi:hypothetical protein